MFDFDDLYKLIQKANDDQTIKLSNASDIYPIGNNKNSPVIIEFISFLKKQSLFSNINKLKEAGITIANDLCLEDREERKQLRYHQAKARS